MSDIRSTYTDECNFYGRHTPRELAETFGTPLYVYNENVLRQRCRDLMGLSKHPGFGVNYSVKANATPALLRIVREEGLVATRRAGKQVIYRVSNNDALQILHTLYGLYCQPADKSCD